LKRGSQPPNNRAGTRKALGRRPAGGRGVGAAQHYQAIIESSDDAILSKDLDSVILSWNNGAERLFGFSAEEAVGRPVTIIIPRDRLDEEPAIIEKIHRGERIHHFETVRQRKDGSLIDISLTISPIRNSRGTIVGASKIARDITELKKARERQHLLQEPLRSLRQHRELERAFGDIRAQACRIGPRAPFRAGARPLPDVPSRDRRRRGASADDAAVASPYYCRSLRRTG
jgi:PAS domain S-box-containing protein